MSSGDYGEAIFDDPTTHIEDLLIWAVALEEGSDEIKQRVIDDICERWPVVTREMADGILDLVAHLYRNAEMSLPDHVVGFPWMGRAR
jgi:hypothetical protein